MYVWWYTEQLLFVYHGALCMWWYTNQMFLVYHGALCIMLWVCTRGTSADCK